MNLHEYQAKDLLRRFGLPILPGRVCRTADEVHAAAIELGAPVVVKAQVHAGGRGKAGGIKLADSPDAARNAAGRILGMRLVTAQTGGEGALVRKVLVQPAASIAQEFYLSMVLDRGSRAITLIASAEGGVEIESVAAANPEAILKMTIDRSVGFQSYQGMETAFRLGLDLSAARRFTAIAEALYRAFVQCDLLLVEINPLVRTAKQDFILLDAKCSIDDNALFRHPEIAAWADEAEQEPRELRAAKAGLNYVAMDGDIGCLVNGAGLAMATMDIIKHHGGSPANFLDVGGGATQEGVTEAFRILLADEKLEAILVNIFGGIMKCDIIANGIVHAARELGIKVPLVVRLQGTNVELGREILGGSGLAIITADTMSDAAEKVIAAAKARRCR